MIDVHCHMQFHKFEDDYDTVIKNAFAEGVDTIINVGTSIESSQKGVALAEKYQNLYAIIGVHPHHADKLEDHWLEELETLTKHPKVIGIGEIGMDYYSYQSNGIVDPKLQREAFLQQIELAYQAKLPLQIHNRHAGPDVIKILQEQKHLLLETPGMFHCFAGDMDMLKAALNMGFHIGFDGNITYKGLAPGETVELKDLAAYTPLDRIVVETDSPYLTPIPYRGQRNEPKYVIITAKFIAELKGIPFEQLVEQTDKNVYTIFRKIKNQK